MLYIVSDFAFLTRFFVLIIVSSCVIFPRDGHGAGGDADVPSRVVPSLTIQLPQADVQRVVVRSPCGIDSRRETIVTANLLFVVSISPIRRTPSGILACLDRNHEVAQEAFSVFNDVVRMKRDSISNIDTSKREIENSARIVLKENGFIWGSIYSELDYSWKSEEAEKARKSGYDYFALAIEMMELLKNHTENAKLYLGSYVDLDLFQRNLGETIADCRVLLRKIEEEKSILARIETYVPTSPVSYTSRLCDYY